MKNATAAILAGIVLAGEAPAQLSGQLGILTPDTLAGNNPATGAPWELGDTYHLVFVTTASTEATSTDIDFYNTFVSDEADSEGMGAASWFVMASTATTNAKDNAVITGPVINIFDQGIVADDADDLWDLDFSASTNPTTLTGDPKNVHSGTAGGGTSHGGYELGATGGNLRIAWSAWASWALAWRGESTSDLKPLVAISEELQIVGPGTKLKLTISRVGTGYKLDWESQDGMLYNVRSSSTLTGDISSWTLVEGNIEAMPPSNTKTVNPPQSRLFYAVEEFPEPPLFSADFENGPDGFTNVNKGTGGVWSHGDPESLSLGGGAVTTGNRSSAQCWGTNLTDGYVAGTDTCLRSPVINLTGIANATLSFAEAIDILDTETPPHELVVNVIDDTTDTILQAAVHTSTPDPDIITANWSTVSGITITGGQPIRIEWRFTGDGDGNYLGAYIDDVLVEKAP